MRMAEHGANPISKETWVKAEKLMREMGHNDATWTGISQRWSKFLLKNFQNQYSQALGNGDDAAAPAPARRAKRQKRAPQKREREEEEGDDDEATVKKDSAAKKQKIYG
ncbi:hypothetical protein F4823DRAFT_560325 [Ustulina deusta]|nr:hypothetical protein F4823DRAFT_560325 [Ustulina deusta]